VTTVLVCSAESAQRDLEEFQAGSRELEAELETQLEAAENKNKELIATNARLSMEVDGLRVSFSLYICRMFPVAWFPCCHLCDDYFCTVSKKDRCCTVLLQCTLTDFGTFRQRCC